MKKFIYTLFLIIMFFSSNAFGQVGVPCHPSETGFFQSYPIPQSYPVFRTDMPHDVMIAYIAMDSIIKSRPYEEVESFIANLRRNDTLKFIRKYIFQVVDYDPLLFKYYKFFHYPNRISLGSYLSELSVKIHYMNFNSTLKYDRYFFNSDLITHIKVLTTEKKIVDEGETTEIGICGEVIDKIKGQNIHNNYCLPMYKQKSDSLSKKELLSFFYQTNWDLNSSQIDDAPIASTNIIEKYGENYFKVGEEYIVFNVLGHICMENNIGYFYYLLERGHKEDLLIYPIKDGIVIDENDTFGFGTGLTIAEFKAKLRERIQQIKEMRY